jgi:hypothetical protein
LAFGGDRIGLILGWVMEVSKLQTAGTVALNCGFIRGRNRRSDERTG